jgi:High potential iron-sulfur protein
MQKSFSRRALVNGALKAATFVAALRVGIQTASAATLTPLDPSDPMAKSLGYVTDTSTVDAGANPTHKPDQKCATCAQFQGKPGDTQGGCTIFAGKSVAAGGWCKVWAKKP